MTKTFRLAAYTTAVAAAIMASNDAFAQTNAVANGEWSSTSTWSAGVPDSGILGGTPLHANINDEITVTVNSFGNHTNLLDVGTASGETGTLHVEAGDLTITDPSGTEPNLPSIRIGQAAGSSGTFNMSGGDVIIDGGTPNDFAIGDLIVGDVGSGAMTVTGGTLSASDEIIIGLADVSNGVVNVSGGNFRAEGRSILVGFNGNGELNVSGDGFVRANFDLLVGINDAEVNQSGGTIEAGFMFSNVFGGGGDVVFNQTGGTFNARIAFVLGQGAGTSTMNHSGGVVNAPTNNGDFVVGDGNGNTSTYNMSGTAEVNMLHTFLVGVFEGSNGTVNQTGGTVTNIASTTPEGRDGIIVGRDGVGTYNISGGAIDVTNVFLGDFDSSTGTMKISGGAVNLSGNFNVGGALASNALPDRVEPNGSNGPQGQALDANGVLIVSGNSATIEVAGNFLANPNDKSEFRSDPFIAGADNSATLGFEIFSEAGTSLIDVAGDADLDGAVVDLDLMGGFTPSDGATFNLLTAASFGSTGSGTTQNVGSGDGFTLASEDAGSFTLAVVPGGNGEILQATFVGGGGGFTADFDNDGDVDGQDLNTWKTSFGASNAGADADDDGDSDGRDFLAWQRQLGSDSAAPAVAAVPEPTAALLMSIAAVALAARRR
jgi:T5SS/PEP-CTERM-associated repeat protein